MKPTFSAAFWSYDRTQPIEAGLVEVEGCDINHFNLNPEEMFQRALFHAEFDITELSLSHYLTHHSRGKSPYIAVPVFPARMFRHSAVYVNRSKGINKPQDLTGRRVGIPQYAATAAVWVRGFLSDDYGIKPTDIQWITGALEEKGSRATRDRHLPENIQLSASDSQRTLSELLLVGEIDALVSPRAPSCFLEQDRRVARLFEDFVEVEMDYFRRTRIFPIMHVMTIKKSTLELHPWLANSVLKAWDEARKIAQDNLFVQRVPVIMLPWVSEFAGKALSIMGPNFWPYGIEGNREVLDTFLRYHHEQGLSADRLPIETLFAPSTLEKVLI